MENIKIQIDVEAIADTLNLVKEEIEQAVNDGVQKLASATHAHVIELAQEKLHTTRDRYLEALSFEEVVSGVYVVSLDLDKAGWIEEGRKCVVYGKNGTHEPTVLTPDGEIKIGLLKKGQLVLNQYGKWTEVVEIYDERLVEKSSYNWSKVEFCSLTTRRTSLHAYVGICNVCGYTVKYNKYHNKNKNLRCTECLSKQKIVTIELSGVINGAKRKKTKNKLVLTHDHKVMTQYGWVPAADLDEKIHKLYVPSWSTCSVCSKPTFMGASLCPSNDSVNCAGKQFQNNLLKNGKHISQSPEWRSKYAKTLSKSKRKNKTEEKMADVLREMGYIVDFFDKNGNNNADWIREYPVKTKTKDSLNRVKYYYIDFYNPKLKLGLEVDGKIFHCKKRDLERDVHIKEKTNIDIVRVPAKKVWHAGLRETILEPILKNHSNDINFIPIPWFKKRTSYIKKFSKMNRRWDITVKNGESFVCNGIVIHNSGSMLDDLLRDGAKTSKDGNRYKAIPFEHSKAPSQMNDKAKKYVSHIKAELKQRGLPYKKLELGSDGSPRIGKLHQFNIKSTYPSAKAKNPALHGLTIYQHKDEKTGKVRRDIMTFRIASDKHRAEGLWFHPGIEPKKFLDQAAEWAVKTFETDILPNIMERFK